MLRAISVFFALIGLFALFAAPQAQAAVDEKFKVGWENSFTYIESSFTEGILLDTAFDLLPTRYVPFVGQAKKILARAANNLSLHLKPLGIDSTKYAYTAFDGVQLLRLVYALERGKVGNLSAAVRGELLAYSLCPWQVPQCSAEVKSAIYKRRGWN